MRAFAVVIRQEGIDPVEKELENRVAGADDAVRADIYAYFFTQAFSTLADTSASSPASAGSIPTTASSCRSSSSQLQDRCGHSPRWRSGSGRARHHCGDDSPARAAPIGTRTGCASSSSRGRSRRYTPPRSTSRSATAARQFERDLIEEIDTSQPTGPQGELWQDGLALSATDEGDGDTTAVGIGVASGGSTCAAPIHGSSWIPGAMAPLRELARVFGFCCGAIQRHLDNPGPAYRPKRSARRLDRI